MVPHPPEDERPINDLLQQRGLASYLGSDERLCHALTNQRVGVERVDDDGDELQVRPGEEYGAVAALTDRRVLLLVGDPPDNDGGDYVTSLPYADIVEAEAATELLTARLEFRTRADATWSFTAREADVEDVAEFLGEACGVWGEVTVALEALADHLEALASALESADWTTFDEHRSAAEEALSTAREGADAAPFDGVADRVERLEAEFYRLVRDRHVVRGEELLAEARRLLSEHQYGESYDRVGTARDRFQDATDLATTHDVDDEAAQEGLAAADELADTVADRPLAAARELYDAVDDDEPPADRVDALEETLDEYRAVAALFTDEDVPIEGDEEQTREETEAVIADLIEAREERATERWTSGDWEWDAGNDETAYDLFSGARDDLDRAIELAEQFPPGDADRLRQRREELAEEFDLLAIRYEIERTNDRLGN